MYKKDLALNHQEWLICHEAISWWGSNPGTLENVEYPFIAISPRSTVTQSGSIC